MCAAVDGISSDVSCSASRGSLTSGRHSRESVVDYYFALSRGGGVLWWPCLSVCVFVCPPAYLRNFTPNLLHAKNHLRSFVNRPVHLLAVGHRITYKLCLTTWKTLHTSLYLSELISHYFPPRSLRSSNTHLFTRPAGITSNFSSRAFSVSTFYLELFTCTHSLYRYPIQL